MLRDILVHVDGSDAGRRQVRFAVELAGRTGARLSGLHVTPPPDVPPLYKPSLIDKVAEAMSADLASRARAAAAAFREEAIAMLPDTTWSEASGNIAEGISAHARYADLVIVGQSEWQRPPEAHPLPVAHSVVQHCGRPVLVVPALAPFSVFARAAVAWDGSREAVRAVHDALPLLHLSQSVRIVSIVGAAVEPDEADIENLYAHLGRHGIRAEGEIFRVTSAAEHKALKDQAEHGHYDLLVMGAYSHPLWLEFIFGGATRSMLMASSIPILVSH
ncbi:universal stress protein [Microvirga sp. M2]|uniref:universal stress protein n=1 Tax=Microvirga sp. M2 TaxID=3073270 RepID=UPI0039C4D333